MRSTLSLCKDYIRSPPYYLQCSSFLASTSYISRQPSYIIIFQELCTISFFCFVHLFSQFKSLHNSPFMRNRVSSKHQLKEIFLNNLATTIIKFDKNYQSWE